MYVYDSVGTYTVELTVSDSKQTATHTRNVTVSQNLDGAHFLDPNRFEEDLEDGRSFSYRFGLRLVQAGGDLSGSRLEIALGNQR